MLPPLITKLQLNQASYQEFIENEWEGFDRNENANVLNVIVLIRIRTFQWDSK